MSVLHSSKLIHAADADMRIARIVAKALRKAGFVPEYFDKRDVFGARLVPPNLRVDGAFVVCRRASARLTAHELAQLEAHYRPWKLQTGPDAAALVGWLRLRSAKHWNG